MDTALVTFVYPKAEKFFKLFLSNLSQQSDTDFMLYVFSDGCTVAQLSPFTKQYSFPVKLIDNKANSIAQSRLNAFRLLKLEQCKSYVFCDIDDIFDRNRVEVVKSTLANVDIVVNDLTLCDEDGVVIQEKMISSYLREQQNITADMLKEQNLIGFSHLAVNHNIIDYFSSISIDHNISVVDWVIMSRVLQHYNAYFERNTCTRYLFHQDNLALSHSEAMERFLFCLEIKIRTYSQLLDLNDWYRNEMDNLIQLQKIINDDDKVRQRLVNYKGESNKYYPWWSQFKNSEELKHEICL